MCKSRKGTVRSSEAWKSQAMPGWWASLPGQHNIWRMRRCHQPLQTGFYESKRESVAPAKESSHRVVSRHKSQLFRRRTCASSEPATRHNSCHAAPEATVKANARVTSAVSTPFDGFSTLKFQLSKSTQSSGGDQSQPLLSRQPNPGKFNKIHLF